MASNFYVTGDSKLTLADCTVGEAWGIGGQAELTLRNSRCDGTGGTIRAPGQFLTLRRTWADGDSVAIEMDMPVALLPGGHSYPWHFAVRRGPQVLALDSRLNDDDLAEATVDASRHLDLSDAAARLPEDWFGAQAYLADFVHTAGGAPTSR